MRKLVDRGFQPRMDRKRAGESKNAKSPTKKLDSRRGKTKSCDSESIHVTHGESELTNTKRWKVSVPFTRIIGGIVKEGTSTRKPFT